MTINTQKTVFSRLASQSVSSRYFASLLGNVLKMALSLASGLIIARGLGPDRYGDYTFLVTSFVAIRQLLDMGSSQAFFTFISRRRQSFRFYLYYAMWLAIQFSTTVVFICLLCPQPLRARIWIDHSIDTVLLAFVASFMMNQVWECLTSVGESIRDSVFVHLRNVTLALVYALILLVLFLLDRLNIRIIFGTIILIYSLFSLIYIGRIKNRICSHPENDSVWVDMFKEFKEYCTPLVVYSWFGFVYMFADVWLLQQYGGSRQQGYYAIGMRFCTISLLATTSMLKIFWKEVAEATEHDDQEKVTRLYKKTTKVLYFSSATLSCFLIPFSKEILTWVLGPSYTGAAMPLMLLFLYPLHQSLGQITNTLFLSTGRVRQYRNIGLIMMVLSLPASYFLVATRDAIIPGMGIGAMGLAIKMLFLQLIEVTAKGVFISRALSIAYEWAYQLKNVVILLICGFLSKSLVGVALFRIIGSKPSIVWLGFSSVVYLSFTVAVVFTMPSLVSSTRSELMTKLKILRSSISLT